MDNDDKIKYYLAPFVTGLFEYKDKAEDKLS